MCQDKEPRELRHQEGAGKDKAKGKEVPPFLEVVKSRPAELPLVAGAHAAVSLNAAVPARELLGFPAHHVFGIGGAFFALVARFSFGHPKPTCKS